MRHDMPVQILVETVVFFIESATKNTKQWISAMKRYFVEAKARSDKH